MSTARLTHRLPRAATAAAAFSALALTLGACAGSAGAGGGGGGGEAGEGFAYDAPQEDVDAAIADLDPVTITFQPSSASPDSVMAPAGTVFKEIVEERSGGKITVRDGPFAEAKEWVGGYFIVQCRAQEEAVAIARRSAELHREHAPGMELVHEVRRILDEE